MSTVAEEMVAWLRGRTGAHDGGFTCADDVADALEREFVRRNEVLVENLPMYVNLGDMGSLKNVIGFAKVIRDSETRQNKIEITLDEDSSATLGNMVDVFDLKAIGFAGIKRLIHEREG